MSNGLAIPPKPAGNQYAAVWDEIAPTGSDTQAPDPHAAAWDAIESTQSKPNTLPVMNSAPKAPAMQPRKIGGIKKPAETKPAQAPHDPTALEQVGQNLQGVAKSATPIVDGAYKWAKSNIPVIGDFLKLGEEATHNPVEAAAAAAANVPAGIMSIPQGAVNLSNQLTRQQRQGTVPALPPGLDFTGPARHLLDQATQTANVLMHRPQEQPVQVKEAYQQPFNPLLQKYPGAAAVGDLGGQMAAGALKLAPALPTIAKAAEAAPILHGIAHGAATGFAYGTEGALADQAAANQAATAGKPDAKLKGLNLKKAAGQGVHSVAAGAILGGAGGIIHKLSSQKNSAAEAKTEAAPETPPETPPAEPTTISRPDGRKEFSFAPGQKEKLEAKDAAAAEPADTNPFLKIRNIGQFKDGVVRAFEDAKTENDVLQIRNDAAQWINKNAADKEVKAGLTESLKQVHDQRQMKLKADAQKAEIERRQAEAAAKPQEPPPVQAPPRKPLEPLELTPEQKQHAARTEYVSKNYPRYQDDIGDYDFSNHKSSSGVVFTHENQYKLTDEQRPLGGLRPTEMYGDQIDSYLEKLDATRDALKHEYERAAGDASKRSRITRLLNKVADHEQAIVHEKGRRTYLEQQGVKPDWPVQEESPVQEPPSHDYASLPDEELHRLMQQPEHFEAALAELDKRYPAEQPNGTDTTEQPPAPEPVVPSEPARSEPAPANIQAGVPDGPGYRVDKRGAVYHILDRDNNELSKTKDRKQAEARVEALNSGAKHGQGRRTDKLGPQEPPPNESTSYQRAVIDNASGEASALPPEIQAHLSELGRLRHAYDQAVEEYRAVENAARNKKGLDLKRTAVRKYSAEVEKMVAEQAKADDPSIKFGIEVNTADRLPARPDYKFKAGEKALPVVEAAYNKVREADKAFREHREAVSAEYISRRQELPASINFEHAGRKMNVRLVDKSRPYEASDETEPSHNYTEIKKLVAKDPYLEQKVTPDIAQNLAEHGVGGVVANLAKELATHDPAVLQGVMGDVGIVAQAAVKLKNGLAKQGIHIGDVDPAVINKLLMNQTNSDKYEVYAHPEFYEEYARSMGRLELALQGVERLETDAEKEAWHNNRYSTPSEIRAGAKGADKLSPDQREGLIKQNKVLNDLTDAMEQYAEHLREQGYKSEFPAALVGNNNLLWTLEADLAQLHRGKYGRPSSFVEKAGSSVTRGMYDMLVTGNYHIHGLHVIEAATVGTAYHPAAFTSGLASLINSEKARGFVESFEASGGIDKKVKEESTTLLGKHWRALQAGALDKAGELVGQQGLSDTLAHNKVAKTAGDIVEGSILETAKVGALRAMTAHIAADEMNYPGGGTKLMEDMHDALTDPSAMDPELQVEAAARMWYHMNQMIGYAPHGYTDMNVLGRMSQRVGPWIKWLTPFMTTRIQQARVLTKFFTNGARSIKAGDYKAGTRSVVQGLGLLGLVSLFGGRAAINRETQDLLHAVAPKTAKDFLEAMDRCNIIGGMLNTNTEHITPVLFFPAYLGDSFIVQSTEQLMNIADKEDLQRLRGIAVAASMLGIGGVGDRMGWGTMLKFARAFREGAAGTTKAIANKPGGTGGALAKLAGVSARAANKLGADIKVKGGSGILDSKEFATDFLWRLYDVTKTGDRIDIARFKDEAVDDAAFGDQLKGLDQKLYERLSSAKYKAQKKAEKAAQAAAEAGDKAGAKRILDETSEQLRGYWERHFEEHMRNKEDNGKEYAQTASHGEA